MIRRHGDVLEPVYEADPEGRPVVHHRTVDTLGIMLRAGTITKDMHDAARDFQAQFTIACYDTFVACRLIAMPGEAAIRADLTEAQIDARRRVDTAHGRSRRAWQPGRRLCLARRRSAVLDPRVGDAAGVGRTADVASKQAQGILVAALGVLAGHYGYCHKQAAKGSCPLERSYL